MYVGNLHSRLPYLAVLKELSADRLQKKKKTFTAFILDISGWAWRPVGEGVRGGHQKKKRKKKKSPIPSGGSPVNVQRDVKTPSPILSISDRLQTVSERLRACFTCACTPNGAGSGENRSGVTARRANGGEEQGSRLQSQRLICLNARPLPPLLLTSVLTVNWIKQQSEVSSSPHWDVGHWLQPIQSGKIREAWCY